MQLMLQATLCTDNRDELHDLAGEWYGMSLRALGLEYDHDPALLDEIDEALRARCQYLPGRPRRGN